LIIDLIFVATRYLKSLLSDKKEANLLAFLNASQIYISKHKRQFVKVIIFLVNLFSDS